MKSKRKTVHLDKSIIEDVDDFINKYVNHTRGRVINIVTSLFLLLDKKKQKKYLVKAKNYIKKSPNIDEGVGYGERRKGKTAVQFFISDELEKQFNSQNNKQLIIAALIYVGIIKDGE